jgi:hypothetical protein
MNASPFVAPFATRSGAHEGALQTLQDMLDSWLQARALLPHVAFGDKIACAQQPRHCLRIWAGSVCSSMICAALPAIDE